VLLCVGSHGVGAATLRVATSRARRSGGVLRLLHVAETTTPMGLEEAQQRLDPVAEVARSFGGDSVRVEPVLAFGEVLDQVWSAAATAALVVLERPAVVRLGGLRRRTSLTTALVEHLEAAVVVVPGRWSAARVDGDGLPPGWHGPRGPRTVGVLLDEPAECRQVVGAGLESAADLRGAVELLRGWEVGRARVVAASRRASLLVVGRGGRAGGLSVSGRVALHESGCPVLVVPVPPAEEDLATVLQFRRAH
jgi:nucleotide-binding universal stress UspA family protein